MSISVNQSFDYFTGNEPDQYQFFQMPMMLIKDEVFRGLSGDAKILYGLLLNRTSLSAKNGWRDELDRVYIFYPIDEIMTDLNCGNQKAIKCMRELKDIGLVRTIRQGLGRANIIYVMNFSTSLKYQRTRGKPPENPENTEMCADHISPMVIHTHQMCADHTSPMVIHTHQKMGKSPPSHTEILNQIKREKNILTHDESQSRQSQSQRMEENGKCGKLEPDVAGRKTSFEPLSFEVHESSQVKDVGNEIVRRETAEESEDKKKPPPLGLLRKTSVLKKTENTTPETPAEIIPETAVVNRAANATGAISDYEKYVKYREIIEDNISFYKWQREEDIARVSELVDCMLDVICSKGETVRIGKTQKNRELVKSVYLKINDEDISTVMERFEAQKHPIRYTSNYLKTMLYNVRQEGSHYQTNSARADGFNLPRRC